MVESHQNDFTYSYILYDIKKILISDPWFLLMKLMLVIANCKSCDHGN